MIAGLTCGIVVYDEIDEIQRLIPRLQFALKDYETEWIIVLNHEQSEIRKWICEWLAKTIKNLKCIENPANNLGLARQLILENAAYEYVYLTDPDVEIEAESLSKLLKLTAVDLNAHLNQPINKLKIIGYGGAVTHQSDNAFLQKTFDLFSFITKFFPFAFQIQNHPHISCVDHLPACHLLLDKTAALSVGGFSGHLDRCGEDLDFTHRAFNQDFCFIFLPSSKVIHRQNFSFTKWLKKMFIFGRVQIFVQKINFKDGVRLYRLLPLILLTSAIGVGFCYFNLFVLILFGLLTLSLAKPAVLGVTLTILSYSLGELFELIWPTFEYKNEDQLQGLNADLHRKFAENQNNILP